MHDFEDKSSAKCYLQRCSSGFEVSLLPSTFTRVTITVAVIKYTTAVFIWFLPPNKGLPGFTLQVLTIEGASAIWYACAPHGASPYHMEHTNVMQELSRRMCASCALFHEGHMAYHGILWQTMADVLTLTPGCRGPSRKDSSFRKAMKSALALGAVVIFLATVNCSKFSPPEQRPRWVS